MKQILLAVTLLLSTQIYAQTTITSVASGNANNPLIWDCLCFPTPGDDVIINHDVTMNVNWLVTAGGSITVSSSGTFIEDVPRGIALDGAGAEFINMGTTDLTNMSFTNGAIGENHSTMSLDSGLWVGSASTFTNNMALTDLNDFLAQGVFTNTGWLGCEDIWNQGTWTNSGNIDSDSLLNTGTFTSTAGLIQAIDFGNDGTMDVSGTSWLDISQDFYNTGDFTLQSGRDMYIGDDFWNGDTLFGSANLINDGLIEVGQDFWNGDSLDGSGIFCIGNSSANVGTITGTLDICDNSGTGIVDTNIGTIDAGVTDCNSGCSVGIAELQNGTFNVYPNPAIDALNLPQGFVGTYMIYSTNGQLMGSGSANGQALDVQVLPAGVYAIVLNSEAGQLTSRFIKQR